MSVSTREAELRSRLRKASTLIAQESRQSRRSSHPEALPAARQDHVEARLELAIIQSLAEAPGLSAERRAALAEMLTAGDSK